MPTLDPVVLFFLLGLAAGLARADLRLPGAIYEFLSMVRLAIGAKQYIGTKQHPGRSALRRRDSTSHRAALADALLRQLRHDPVHERSPRAAPGEILKEYWV
ncbi:MAG: sodium-dependent bicarbonate transport family permease [Rugosibacter sp.]|nr:sodium-dependent bicarbonate transport family permease [Rugosibacter sp.]